MPLLKRKTGLLIAKKTAFILAGNSSKGYGTILLKIIIEEARKMNLEKVLITVRNRNTNSIKVALNNNGKIEKVNKERHYIWIDC